MSGKDSLIHGFTSHKCTQETAGKRVASAVGIDNLSILQAGDGEDFWLVRLRCRNDDC
jgi:hypothetical protein